MDQKRFELLRKRAQNCIEKFMAIRDGQTDSAMIHSINTSIWRINNGVSIVEKYNENFVGGITGKHLDLNWLEGIIKSAENRLIDLAKVYHGG